MKPRPNSIKLRFDRKPQRRLYNEFGQWGI